MEKEARIKYRLEIFEDNNWITQSYHKNKDWAIINADVLNNSRGLSCRVIFNGDIIYFLDPKEVCG